MMPSEFLGTIQTKSMIYNQEWHLKQCQKMLLWFSVYPNSQVWKVTGS